jgi:activator of HSP90 ATPase
MVEKTELWTTNAPSRRQMICGSLFALSGVAVAGAQAQGKSTSSFGTEEIIRTRAIHHEVDFHATPERVYDALLDSRQFKTFSGGRSAEINREVGGTFSIFSGHIVGRNLELVPARRIVQAWRVVPWPEGLYSIARFELEKQGSGTRLVFDHTGFPTEEAEHLSSGWQDNYWKALRAYFG